MDFEKAREATGRRRRRQKAKKALGRLLRDLELYTADRCFTEDDYEMAEQMFTESSMLSRFLRSFDNTVK